MKTLFPLQGLIAIVLLCGTQKVQAQKLLYEIYLFGNKIGTTEVERIEKDSAIIEYKLFSSTSVNVLFIHRSVEQYTH